jgi:hypothetical protein
LKLLPPAEDGELANTALVGLAKGPAEEGGLAKELGLAWEKTEETADAGDATEETEGCRCGRLSGVSWGCCDGVVARSKKAQLFISGYAYSPPTTKLPSEPGSATTAAFICGGAKMAACSASAWAEAWEGRASGKVA